MSRPPDLVLIAGRDPLSELGGGHSSYVRAHARAALRLGLRPRIFCVAAREAVVETEFGPVHRVDSPWRPFRQLMVAGHGPWLAAGIAAALGDGGEAPVLLHAFGAWGHAGRLAARALGRRGRRAVPIISAYTTHAVESRARHRASRGYAARTWLGLAAQAAWSRVAVEPLERRAYRAARLVLVNYESVGRLVTARFGPGVAWRRIPYAPESAFLEEAGDPAPTAPAEPGAPPLIVSVARHEPGKGGAVLLRALGALRARGIPFRACLAGEGPLLAAHRAQAGRLGLGALVTLPGLVPDAPALIRRADVFVLASLAEQSGSLAVLEALQAGRAVVASAVDGLLEDLTDGEDGLLVPPGDPARLADSVARLLADRDLRLRLGRHARRTFERRFSAAGFADALGSTYAALP